MCLTILTKKKIKNSLDLGICKKKILVLLSSFFNDLNLVKYVRDE